MKLFARITKVDVEKREVWGRAVEEVPDKAKEIFDYESSVPHFKNWSSSFEKATASLPEPSLGNIRSMHGKVAAGKVISIEYNDAEKAIDIGTKIVDDNEWQKCMEGVHTGFSIGGSYLKKWKDATDATLTRYTAQPGEISLVDNPCVPTALFTIVKAEGVTEEHAFQRFGLLKAAIEKTDLKLGELLDLTKEYLPWEEIDALAKSDATVDDWRNRLQQLVSDAPAALEKVAETPATPTPESGTPAAVEKTTEPAEDKPAEKAENVVKVLTHLRKGMYSVQTFAGILQSLAWLAQDTQWEAEWEQDGSTIPADLRTAIQLLCQIFKKMSAEETDELIAGLLPEGVEVEVIQLAAPSGDLSKAGKRHSKADMEMIQAVHDHSASLGADCSTDTAKMAKFATLAPEQLEKLEKVATLEKSVLDLTTERDALQKRTAELEAMPLPGKGVVRAIGKADDDTAIGTTDETPQPDPADPIGVMKAVHAAGGKRITF